MSLEQAACAGTTEPEVFSSTAPIDHLIARDYCSRCLVVAECAAERVRLDAGSNRGGRPSGTWGGVLFLDNGDPSPYSVTACATCGADFMPLNGRSAYCGKVCVARVAAARDAERMRARVARDPQVQAVACPQCGSGVGERCRSTSGTFIYAHVARVKYAALVTERYGDAWQDEAS